MKALAIIMGVLAPAAAFAATNAPAEDGNGVFVWIFLGFFALIVVGQLVPAAVLITGLLKGLTSKKEAKTEAK